MVGHPGESHTHNEMWLKEGPAEYSGHLAEEWLYGRDAFVDVVKDNHPDILRTAHIVDDGFQVLSPIPDEHCYGTHTYCQGGQRHAQPARLPRRHALPAG